MKTIISITLFGFLYLLPGAAQQNDYAKLKSDAEQFYAAGSYARANDVYSKPNWLIKNRRGAQWSNTRDTAIVVLTLNDYLRTSKELPPQLTYELLVNETSIATKQITGTDAFGAPSKFEIPREVIRDGANEITIRRTSGDGPLYFWAQAKFFSLEEPIAAAGNEIFVRRQYFKLINHPTLLKGFVSERVPLNDGDTVKSGERVETVITIEAKNNYEYLLFEDLKAAGLEAVQLRSGENLYVREIKSGALTPGSAGVLPAARGSKVVTHEFQINK